MREKAERKRKRKKENVCMCLCVNCSIEQVEKGEEEKKIDQIGCHQKIEKEKKQSKDSADARNGR